MVISQYYHKFNKSGLALTLQSRRFFQPEVDSKHSEWNQDSEPGSITQKQCEVVISSQMKNAKFLRIIKYLSLAMKECGGETFAFVAKL
jgi:hypothetical protein